MAGPSVDVHARRQVRVARTLIQISQVSQRTYYGGKQTVHIMRKVVNERDKLKKI